MKNKKEQVLKSSLLVLPSVLRKKALSSFNNGPAAVNTERFFLPLLGSERGFKRLTFKNILNELTGALAEDRSCLRAAFSLCN